jgi:hypothetical protein
MPNHAKTSGICRMVDSRRYTSTFTNGQQYVILGAFFRWIRQVAPPKAICERVLW